MFAVQPQPQGLKSTKVTLIASPGSAPSMTTGPLVGLTLEKSRLGTSFAVQPGVIWPAEESLHLISMVSPEPTVRIGFRELSQPK